ncbi:DUF6883 domain-containing protein [Roseofilum sp. SID3]|uniref:DUF6883 domain-containing protein n=1 Tax=unclassified Roseofilum TaxID=2620099 RepID=UPI000E90E0E0|nr:hypothetical protein [Cyanobacteria bacterium UBA11691]
MLFGCYNHVYFLKKNAIWVEETSYGNKYKIDGTLKGINGIELEVRTIWIVETNYDQARFVTLVPRG